MFAAAISKIGYIKWELSVEIEEKITPSLNVCRTIRITFKELQKNGGSINIHSPIDYF